MKAGLFTDAFVNKSAFKGILPLLGPKAVGRFSQTAKEINGTVQLYFNEERPKHAEVFERAGFVASDPNRAHRNLTNFNTSLKEKIRAYLAAQAPPEIQAVVNSETLLTPDQATQLIDFIQARDHLVVWEVMGRSIEVEDLSQAFVSYDAAIAKAGELPSWMEGNQGNLANLTILDLRHNQLTSVPAELGSLTQLRALGLNNNRLISVPDTLGSLTNLVRLSLIGNQLTEVPEELGQLANLQWLWLHNNQLTEVPATLGNLAQLRGLGLDDNQLTSVPAELGQLHNLERLHLDDNQLTSVPAELGNLANLWWLGLHNNQLTSVPKELGRLAQLATLDLSENQLTSVPAELDNLANPKLLVLNDNPLTEEPAELGRLANLDFPHLDLIPSLKYAASRYGSKALGVTAVAVAAYAAHSFGLLEPADLSGAWRDWTVS